MNKSQDGSNKYKYSAEWIKTIESPDHWIHYWHQANLALKFIRPEHSILEIGVGSAFLSNYLKSKNYKKIKTIDIDKDKKPDILANIVEYKFREKYDYILAFEVFEHVPFEEFKLVLEKLKTHCTNAIILSVPRNEKRWMEVTFKTILSAKENYFKFATIRNKLTTDHHFWEIDYKNYKKGLLENTFRDAGFNKIHLNNYKSTLFYVFKNQNFN